jgi:hypothetical protein
MEKNRILELALDGLQREKERIEAEMKFIQSELKGTGSAIRQALSLPSAGTRRRRRKTSAERKAHAQRMREIWAVRRVQATKPAAPAKTAPAAASTKTRSKTAAQKKALSLKMREVWKRRKAAAAKKAK